MPSLKEKILGSLLYMVPWSECITFGNHLFIKYPFIQIIQLPAIPIILIERSIPFGSLLLFLIIFLGIVRNLNVPYFVRFNACQSLLLNIAIIIFSYLIQIFPIVGLSYLIFLVSIVLTIFSICQCLYGIEPEIPLISRSVRMQI